MNKKHIIWVFVLILVVVGFVFFESEPEQEKLTTVRIGYREHAAYLPLFVGLEEGIFQEHGLEVEPVVFSSTNQLMEAMIAGRIDAALGGVNNFLLLSLEEKSPNSFKIFSSLAENGENVSTRLIVQANSSISSVSELSGKRIGTFPGSAAALAYELIVEENELLKTELVQMEPKLQLQALESGNIDVAFVLEPLATIGEQTGISRSIQNAIWHTYTVEEVPVASSVVSSEFIDTHYEETKALVEATNEAIAYINENHNEESIRDYIAVYTTLSEDVAEKLPLVKQQGLAEMNIDKLQELADWMLANGELKEGVDASKMVLQPTQ